MRRFLGLLFLLFLVVFWNSVFPTFSNKFDVVAVIELDGRRFEATSVWRVTLTQQYGLFDAGWNFTRSSEGNALVFEIDEDLTLFMAPDSSNVIRCLDTAENGSAVVALLYVALCEVPEPTGQFTYADSSQRDGDRPKLGQFGWSVRNGIIPQGGGRKAPDAQSLDLERRGFRIASIQIAPSTSGLGASLAGTYPWIRQLPRYDMPFGGTARFSWVIYANSFTTLLFPSGRNVP